MEDVLDPGLLQALQSNDITALRALARQEFDDVYSIQVFNCCTCEQLRREAAAFRDWTTCQGKVSPGLLLSSRWYLKHIDTKFEQLFDTMLARVVQPLDAALFGHNAPLSYHHDYCICYEETADRGLKPHTDDSDITFNVFLGAECTHTGCELLLLAPTEEDTKCGTPRLDTFAGAKSLYKHEEVGRAVIHPGDRWHAVQPLTSGCRWNLLMWTLRNDRAWKSTFFQDMDAHLEQKASRI